MEYSLSGRQRYPPFVQLIQDVYNSPKIYWSLYCLDLLDELYPEKQLHPKDPREKAKQKLFLERFGETVSLLKNKKYHIASKVEGKNGI